MFIFWGKKIVYRKLGYVADFCPICRSIQPFELKRVGSAAHVYYISVGEGALVGHERTCLECGTGLRADPDGYTSVAGKAGPLPVLLAETFPNLEHLLSERMLLEQKVRNDPAALTVDERRALIQQPFALLSAKVERRFESTHIDLHTGLALVAALALMVLGGAVIRARFPIADDLILMLAVLPGLALVTWKGIGTGRRYMKREVIPVLATSLKPLQPTEDELRSVLADLKRLGHKIGRKLKLNDLMAQLAQ